MATAQDVAKYFLSLDESQEGEGLSNLKLQKLVYYAQGFYSAIFDAPLFDERIEAWGHGPVVPNLYHEFKSFGSNLIQGVPTDDIILNDDERNLIREVHEVFGQFSAWKLRNMTHQETPWLNHEASAGVIPKEDIIEFFKTRIQ